MIRPARLFRATVLTGMISFLVAPALAADPPIDPIPAPKRPYPTFGVAPAFTWTGFYLGYNLGAAWNSQKTVTTFSSPWNTTNIGFIGGLQAGFNYQISSIVLGAEIDGDWMSASPSSSSPSTPGPAGLTKTTGQFNWASSVGLRFGYAANTTLFYGKVGYGWVTQTLAINSPLALDTTTTFVSNTNGGGLYGGGVEFAFPGTQWTAKAEYNYITLSQQKFVVSSPNTVIVTPTLQTLKLGMNYRFAM
ncbi:porin family protein [Bradyrhizobium manausense]|uniref:outer membrane protein n=1 Tax=Bradyrhizobium manausense TaxID=989370 RepID=UPI001BA64579|nr:outer membrane beta-barrel protein [Bradyrhizobium manausense]MBR0832025.1 porin family protein [Bradyrhizobium manausense]